MQESHELRPQASNPTSSEAAQPNCHDAVLAKHRPHVCPWWLGWALANPLRRWLMQPDAVLDGFIQPGDRALEIGPGSGLFTVPLAQKVGPHGKVLCVDVQAKMLEMLQRRLDRSGLGDRIETRCCTASGLGLGDCKQTIDKAVLIYVLHEVPDPRRTLSEVHDVLRPGGMLLLVEPKGHCSAELFAAEIWAAKHTGFVEVEAPLPAILTKRQSVILRKLG